MEKLAIEKLDLYLIHWPNPPQIREKFAQSTKETWAAMEKLYQNDKVRAIGVSNYMPRHLEVLLKNATIDPMVNQIRIHPGQVDDETIDFSVKEGMVVEAYSPFGKGSILQSPELEELGKKYGKTSAQIALRWSLDMGFLPLPKSVTPKRMKENLEVFDFTLTKEEINRLITMKDYGNPPRNPDFTDF